MILFDCLLISIILLFVFSVFLGVCLSWNHYSFLLWRSRWICDCSWPPFHFGCFYNSLLQLFHFLCFRNLWIQSLFHLSSRYLFSSFIQYSFNCFWLQFEFLCLYISLFSSGLYDRFHLCFLSTLLFDYTQLLLQSYFLLLSHYQQVILSLTGVLSWLSLMRLTYPMHGNNAHFFLSIQIYQIHSQFSSLHIWCFYRWTSIHDLEQGWCDCYSLSHNSHYLQIGIGFLSLLHPSSLNPTVLGIWWMWISQTSSLSNQ